MKRLEFLKWNMQGSEAQGIRFSRDDGKFLDISFQGNLDLYFSFSSLELEKNNFFLITKDNYQVWRVFDKLYNDLMECNIYKFTEKDRERIWEWAFLDDSDYHEELKKEENWVRKTNRNLKERYEYQSLVNDGTITWKSDDYVEDIAPFFTIKREEGNYIINLGIPEVKRELNFDEQWMLNDYRFNHLIKVRLRNSGSKYDPLNVVFMQAFNELMKLEEREQIHIEEYMLTREK